MSAQAKQPSAARRGTGGTCPHCGQPLLTHRAVRQLRTTELEFERRLEAALRATFAELAGELAAAETEEEEELVNEPDPSVRPADAEEAAEDRALRLFFRQF